GNVVIGVNAFVTNTVTVSGTVTANQGTSPWVVTLTSTTITGTVAVTQSTSPWVVSGSGNFTVVQPTGSNLHVVVDTAPTTAVTQSTNPWIVQDTTAIASLTSLVSGQTFQNLTVDTLQAVLAQLKLLNLNIASCIPSAYVDNDTWVMDTFPILE